MSTHPATLPGTPAPLVWPRLYTASELDALAAQPPRASAAVPAPRRVARPAGGWPSGWMGRCRAWCDRVLPPALAAAPRAPGAEPLAVEQHLATIDEIDHRAAALRGLDTAERVMVALALQDRTLLPQDCRLSPPEDLKARLSPPQRAAVMAHWARHAPRQTF